ncbi:hypothetical protein C4D60_Mb09t19030 [Musa balbisiana]|uniref:Uncharacterized protein n=1 Tax=Musa balbisiana TaxID=52838 RepID=A0A4S8IHF7_MUSBA|nr:hypothetical protein C4D60_Mb09t19030 [Musa balbisiana]
MDVGYGLGLFCGCFGCSLRVWFGRVLGVWMKVLDLWGSWNSIGVPSSKLLLKGCRKDSSIAYQKRMNT